MEVTTQKSCTQIAKYEEVAGSRSAAYRQGRIDAEIDAAKEVVDRLAAQKDIVLQKRFELLLSAVYTHTYIHRDSYTQVHTHNTRTHMHKYTCIHSHAHTHAHTHQSILLYHEMPLTSSCTSTSKDFSTSFMFNLSRSVICQITSLLFPWNPDWHLN